MGGFYQLILQMHPIELVAAWPTQQAQKVFFKLIVQLHYNCWAIISVSLSSKEGKKDLGFVFTLTLTMSADCTAAPNSVDSAREKLSHIDDKLVVKARV